LRQPPFPRQLKPHLGGCVAEAETAVKARGLATEKASLHFAEFLVGENSRVAEFGEFA
jgi:hypothetical protein